MNKQGHISSLLKILLNYKRGKTFLSSLPIRLWLEIASVCNLKCIMCLNRALAGDKKGLMDFGLFRKIIDEAKDYVYDVYLHHRGEPLLHPEFPQMIEYAEKSGLKVKFHTNGTLMKPDLSRKILRAGPDLVSFSVDGFTKETYEKIRVNANFDETMDNISRFLRYKKELGLRKPYTIIEEIEFPELKNPADEENRKKFSEHFRRLGLDEIIFKKLYNWAGYLAVSEFESHSPNKPALSEVEGVRGERSYTTCTFLWYSATIFWNGTVSPCPQDYYGKIKLGNVNEKPLKEIWNDNEYVSLRQQILSDVEKLSPCNKCDRLYRKKVAGIPLQYLISYLNDNIIGYGKLRKIFGSYERNE